MTNIPSVECTGLIYVCIQERLPHNVRRLHGTFRVTDRARVSSPKPTHSSGHTGSRSGSLVARKHNGCLTYLPDPTRNHIGVVSGCPSFCLFSGPLFVSAQACIATRFAWPKIYGAMHGNELAAVYQSLATSCS